MLARRLLSKGKVALIGGLLASRGAAGYGMASRPASQQCMAAQVAVERAGKTLEELRTDNSFTRELPGDPVAANVLRQVNNALYSYVAPTPTGTDPYLIAYSPEVARELGLDPAECERPEFAAIFSGNAPLPGSQSWAQCYGGHQFGSWAGQLGDGRAISLGQVPTPGGRTLELQLKGAGKTPYSRRADGRAVLRSSLREFVASEAMAALGVPTTRALSLVGTGDQVMRDMFYNGNVKLEPGAVVCRVAPSFVRFGTFQLPVARGAEQLHLVRQLADYVIAHHYPHLQGKEDKYLQFLREVTHRTARLVAMWQAVGFVHGVLNTDNMSILGETIDYGPFGWLERFDPHYTPNSTDLPGRRYAFRNQPEIGQWNVVQLGTALVAAELLEKSPAEEVLGEYVEVLSAEYNARMAAKMGLQKYDRDLAIGLMTNMYEDGADFTNTFRALSAVTAEEPAAHEAPLPPALQQAIGDADALGEERAAAWREWVRQYRAALRGQGGDDSARRAGQDAVNPAYVPRNSLLQDAILGAEAGNFSELHSLMAVLKRPYEEQPGAERFRRQPPAQIRYGVEVLSCSS